MSFFQEGITLRHELTGLSKICDPVSAKFKYVTNIETLRYCVVIRSHTCRHCEISKKADFEPYPVGKKYTTFSSLRHDVLA